MSDRDLLAGDPDTVNPADDPVLHANGQLLRSIRTGAPYHSLDDLTHQFAGQIPGRPGPDSAARFLAINGLELADDGHIMPGSMPVMLAQIIVDYLDAEANEWGESRDVAAARLITEAVQRRGDRLTSNHGSLGKLTALIQARFDTGTNDLPGEAGPEGSYAVVAPDTPSTTPPCAAR